MRSFTLLTSLFLLLAEGISGCSTDPVTKTGNFQPKPRAPGCHFSVYTAPLIDPFKEIGLMNLSVRSPAMAKKYARNDVCKAGGNGLILSGWNETQGYTKGKVIWVKASPRP